MVPAEDDRRLPPIDLKGQRCCHRIVASCGKTPVWYLVAARELGDPAHGVAVVLADKKQSTVTIIQLTSPPRGENRDNDVRHFGDLRHQRQHRAPFDFDDPCPARSAHLLCPYAATEEPDAAHELTSTKSIRQCALTGHRINDLDLAVLHKDKMVHRVALTNDRRACGVVSLPSSCSEGVDMF